MFLPVLLIRDYGVMGWVVFAIPNVIGAAAMGWVLRDGLSERIVAGHSSALEWFRLVTVAFQLFFLLAYLAPPLKGQDLIGVQLDRSIVIGAVLLGLVLGLRPRLAPVAWLVSIACFAFALSQRGGGSVPSLPEPTSQPGLPWLAPVCAFGFALCPYLDPTFHQAHQACGSRQGRTAFTLGFCVFFLAMIAFTLAYAPWLLSVPLGVPGPGAGVLSAIAIHIGLQLAYTCSAHARCPVGHGSWSAPRIAFAMILAGIAALAAAYLPSHAGLEAREIVYRLFMAFYGLVFPAYVWICMIPFGDRRAVDRRSLRVFCTACGLAAPFYWMGFIEHREFFLVPGLAIVLFARLFAQARAATSVA
jgi:hypothetical protein